MQEFHAILRSSYMDPTPVPLSTQCRCVHDPLISLSLSSFCVTRLLKLGGDGVVKSIKTAAKNIFDHFMRSSRVVDEIQRDVDEI